MEKCEDNISNLVPKFNKRKILPEKGAMDKDGVPYDLKNN